MADLMGGGLAGKTVDETVSGSVEQWDILLVLSMAVWTVEHWAFQMAVRLVLKKADCLVDPTVENWAFQMVVHLVSKKADC